MFFYLVHLMYVYKQKSHNKYLTAVIFHMVLFYAVVFKLSIHIRNGNGQY